jgi:hypothetical protein
MGSTAFSQIKFACFESDKNTNLKISVSFDKKEKATFVKYKGQKDSISLFYSKIIKSKNPGGIPAVYWEEVYLEKINGKITGKYSFTNAGTYQLDVTYTRKRDKKEFYFKIIENTIGKDDQPFRESPCF